MGVPAAAEVGEWVLRFEDHDAYTAYLDGLTRAGLAPLGEIDSLYLLRMDEAAPPIHAAEGAAQWGFNYRVVQPPHRS